MNAASAGSLLGAVLLATAGCSDRDVDHAPTPYARGEKIYKNVCIACHDHDPSKPGTIGPPIAGSSRDLLAHRVLHGTYPESYRPKRESHQMPQFPHLAGSIDDLAAYLAEAGSQTPPPRPDASGGPR